MNKWKIATFWVLGAVMIMFGSMIAGRLERGLGVSDVSFTIALILSFMSFLLGGLLWISVGLAVKKISED